MSDIGSGDVVVCVDVDPHEEWGHLPAHDLALLKRLRLGAHYHVTWAGIAWCGNPVVALAEIPDPRAKTGFAVERFRKLRPDEQEPCEKEFTTLIRKMKPVKERSDA